MKRRNFLTLIGAVAAMPLALIQATPTQEPIGIHEVYPFGEFPKGWTYIYAHTVQVDDYNTARRIVSELNEDVGLNIHALRRVEGVPDSFDMPRGGHWWPASIVAASLGDGKYSVTKRYAFKKWEAE